QLTAFGARDRAFFDVISCCAPRPQLMGNPLARLVPFSPRTSIACLMTSAHASTMMPPISSQSTASRSAYPMTHPAVTYQDLMRGLQQLGVMHGAMVEVHSSLSRFGWVE